MLCIDSIESNTLELKRSIECVTRDQTHPSLDGSHRVLPLVLVRVGYGDSEPSLPIRWIQFKGFVESLDSLVLSLVVLLLHAEIEPRRSRVRVTLYLRFGL